MSHNILKSGLIGAKYGAVVSITAAFTLNCLLHINMLGDGKTLPLALMSMALGGVAIAHESELGAAVMFVGAAVGGSFGLGIGVARAIPSFFSKPKTEPLEKEYTTPLLKNS